MKNENEKILEKMQNIHLKKDDIDLNDDEWTENWQDQNPFEIKFDETDIKEEHKEEEHKGPQQEKEENIKEVHYHNHYTINILGFIFQK